MIIDQSKNHLFKTKILRIPYTRVQGVLGFIRKESNIWWIRYAGVDGLIQRETAKTEVKEEAEFLLALKKEEVRQKRAATDTHLSGAFDIKIVISESIIRALSVLISSGGLRSQGPNSMPSLLTAKQVAGLLQCSEATIYEWAGNGKIPSIKLNVRFYSREIEKWIQDNRRKPEEVNIRSQIYQSKTTDLKSTMRWAIDSTK